MKTEEKKESVNVYRVGRMTLLQLMAVLAIMGLVADGVLRYIFAG